MTRKCRDIEHSLVAKGFLKEMKGRRHIMFWFMNRGKKTPIFTFMSHGANEVGDDLIGDMSKQVKLKKVEFLNLVDCTLTAKAYFEKMVLDGHIKQESAAG
ncbi:MAG: hypothetical protein LV481_05370 [Methylacidiphilales bacterium]|nr:hypothetical protein [Candidatus Methylacidiphilales bacterium]